MNTGVYIIRNLWNGKIYVGSSADISRRWQEHIRRLDRGTHNSPKLLRAWKKYGGLNSFEFRIIELCDENKLAEREQYWIDTTLAVTLGYNLRPKAETFSGYKRGSPTPEHRRKNAEAHTGPKSPNWGKPRSEETKRKIAEAQRGIPRKSPSEATRLLMSEKQKARYQRDGVSEAQLKRLDEARKKVAHHLASKETKRKMRESALRRIHTSLLEREIIEAKVIKLLNDKSISYSKISQSVGLSIATIATISKRFGLLRGMGTLPEGYKHPKTAAPR